MALVNFGRNSIRFFFENSPWKRLAADPRCVAVKSVSCGLLYQNEKCRTSCWLPSSVLASTSPTRRHFHSSCAKLKREDRRQMIVSAPKVDEGTQGEKLADVDRLIDEKIDIFPDEKLPNRLFGGVRFADLPICHIKASPNNTLMTLTTASGIVKIRHSCGMEGFKNTREGTNIAAQATAITMGTKAASKGYNTVRVAVQGLGPGRMSAIKGLTMAGINIVSITDVTPISFGAMPRPKKLRKL